MYDAIIAGAGIGGLYCAAKLAKYGKSVLLLEKTPHIGGTSHIFRRGEYYFPMGPLSFSSPEIVVELLSEIGIGEKIDFNRNHFQLITPFFDIVYSQSFGKLREDLKNFFAEERQGIDAFFEKLREIISAVDKIHQWHPDYSLGKKREKILKNFIPKCEKELEIINENLQIPAKEYLEKQVSSKILQNFLGSQTTYEPVMSLTLLAFMWDFTNGRGIWYPSCTIHGINQLIYDRILSNNGEVKLSHGVKEILIKDNRVIGVQTSKGETFESDWVISNADYQKTFLELVRPQNLPQKFYSAVKSYTMSGSELCVYLGVDPQKIDLSKMRAQHVFYRKEIKSSEKFDPEDFDNREIEICLWSDNAPDSAPPGRAVILLRVGFSYDHFSDWRTGEKRRKDGYRDYKKKIAEKLIHTVESLLPGLSNSVEKMEIATPLTYQDWGNRYRGSIAGWSWNIEEQSKIGRKLLIETPIDHLLMVGICSACELFLGGYPTSMYTGNLAADYILEKSG
ncbi:MAG: phytoene desaturase family protein [Candidatus Jordarchaeum sp.]|uniref:phytoene desaturase family protein n=1 Tax=Candidatus Jordarchaeum sp. TaxID=2823881 RepID=UPI00404B9CE6